MIQNRVAISLGVVSVMALLIAPTASFASAPAHIWSRLFGGADDDFGYAVAADPSDNIVVTGAFRGTVDFGGGGLVSAGSSDGVVVKFDPSGAHLWSRRFGDTSTDSGRALAVDASGNVYVAGYFNGTADFGGGGLVSAGNRDVFLAKYDAGGAHLWSQRFGGTSDDDAFSIAVDATGNVILTGQFAGTANFGGSNLVSAGFTDVYVARYDANGTHLWSHRFGGTSSDTGSSVAVDGAGNVLVTGKFVGSVDFGGGGLVSAGSADIFVAKYDANGTHQWSQRFGGTSFDVALSAAADGSGSVVVTGYFQETVDFGGGDLVAANGWDVFLAKYDANGAHQWSQRFGSTNSEVGNAVAVDGLGNVLVTGSFAGTVDFGGGDLTSAGSWDVFLAEYDSGGTHLWSRRIGSTGIDEGNAAAVDGSGNVIVAGDCNGTVDFGAGGLVGFGGGDIFVAKYGNEPVSVAVTSFHADARDTGVSLRAEFRSDLGVRSVNIYRGAGGASLLRVWSVDNAGREEFEYLDRDVTPGATYRYRIGAVDGDGEFLSPEIVVTVPAVMGALEQNTPNPFNPTTLISFSLAERGHVTLSIYDARGALVRVLVNDTRDAGRHHEVWNGRDNTGALLGSGVYFYRLRAGGFTDSRKMVLIK